MNMNLWFNEYYDMAPGKETAGLTVKIKKHLVNDESPYQKIDVLETYEFGNLLLLDGMVMLTEKDEYIYHDMISQVPAQTQFYSDFKPKKALVIGGGDGGTVRELLNVPSLEKIVLCEIDEKVVNYSKEYFPALTSGLSDPRVEVKIGDGIEYVKNIKSEYDIICVDSTDPVGPAVGLFNKSFYEGVSQALTPNGIMTGQTESFFLRMDFIKEVKDVLSPIFKHVQFYNASIPTYPSGTWCFVYASNQLDPKVCENADFHDKITYRGKYYNSRIHSGAFALPSWVEETLEG